MDARNFWSTFMVGLVALAIPFILIAPSPAIADDVLGELSARSNIPTSELTELLADCEKNQLSMNICAFRDAIEVELELDRLVERRSAELPETERAEFLSDMDEWHTEIREQCNSHADELAEGGTMRPMIYSSCIASEMENRMVQMIQSQ